jgi:hypothetical protein
MCNRKYTRPHKDKQEPTIIAKCGHYGHGFDCASGEGCYVNPHLSVCHTCYNAQQAQKFMREFSADVNALVHAIQALEPFVAER